MSKNIVNKRSTDSDSLFLTLKKYLSTDSSFIKNNRNVINGNKIVLILDDLKRESKFQSDVGKVSLVGTHFTE